MQKSNRGVYFLANNKVFEQTVAFLRSFRAFNPTIPLCLIPFDSNFDQIAALKDTYSYDIFDNEELLAACDSISEKFHDRVLGTYRKLVAWEGKFDAFVYIDVDTVVLDSIDFAFEHLQYGQYVASHSNLENIRCWVWKDSIYEKNFLTQPQIAYSTNTGFFASIRGMLPMKHCIAKVDSALQLKVDMELMTMEQPFLNYLVVTSGYVYTSLLVLRNAGISDTTRLEFWAGLPNGLVKDGKIHVPEDWPIFLVHWAGIWYHIDGPDGLPYKELWDFYRRTDIAPEVFPNDLRAPCVR
jgi:hypothetical protein